MNSRRRVPEMENVRVTRMVNGPEGFTPDNEFCLGETEIGGLFVAAGFCAHGLAGAGGVGKVMAEWIAEGEPSLDLWHMDIRRFGAQYRSPSYSLKRIRETYETYYDIKYPRYEREAGRPLRVSPANAWHREHGAASGRNPAGSGSTGTSRTRPPATRRLRPRGWAGRNWSPAIGAEHAACREAVARVRRELVRQARDRRPGRRRAAGAALRQPRRARGRPDHVHADAELARRDRVRLHGRAARRRSASRSSPGRPSATTTASGSAATCPATAPSSVQDVTSAWACLGIWGPRSRERARAG